MGILGALLSIVHWNRVRLLGPRISSKKGNCATWYSNGTPHLWCCVFAVIETTWARGESNYGVLLRGFLLVWLYRMELEMCGWTQLGVCSVCLMSRRRDVYACAARVRFPRWWMWNRMFFFSFSLSLLLPLCLLHRAATLCAPLSYSLVLFSFLGTDWGPYGRAVLRPFYDWATFTWRTCLRL